MTVCLTWRGLSLDIEPASRKARSLIRGRQDDRGERTRKRAILLCLAEGEPLFPLLPPLPPPPPPPLAPLMSHRSSASVLSGAHLTARYPSIKQLNARRV